MKAAWAAGLTAYFAYFTWDSLSVKFAADDLMNMAHYWRMPGRQLLLEFAAPWVGGYRPMGAAFYLPLFKFFGLDPVPYHAALLAILLANVFLVYRLARALGCSEPASGVAALVACFHGGLNFLYYDTAFIYDALCCFFYLAALAYYVSIRSRGERLGPRQLAMLAALHWAAWQSKEIAATLPAVVLAYEAFCQKRRQFSGAVVTGIVNLPFLYGLFFAKQSITGVGDYKPVLSAARVLAFERMMFADLVQAWHGFTIGWAMAVLALITVLAWWRKHPALRFCWCFLVISPAPLALLEGRSQACLVVPMCALAILVATVLADAADAVAARLGGRRAVSAGMLALAVIAWARYNDDAKQTLIRPQMEAVGAETWAVIQQFRGIGAHARPNSTVLFLNDPFETYDMAFIAELWFRQPGLNIRLNRKTPFTPEEIAKADHVFSYEQGKLAQIR